MPLRHTKLALALWLTGCLSLLACAPAQAAPPPLTSLREASEAAFTRNPEAAALGGREQALRAAREQANSLTPEPGALGVSSRNDRLNQQRGQQELELEITTPLWLPGQKAARQGEADSRIDQAAATRLALRWEIAGEVREAWWALALARHARAQAEQRQQSANTLKRDVLRRHQAGELSRIDANLAQNEALEAESSVIEAGTALARLEQEFTLLSGAPAPATLSEETASPPASAQAERLDAPPSHPLLLRALGSLNHARARAKVAQQSGRAAPELGLRMVRERSASSEPWANSIGVRLTIPFSSGAQVREADANASAETQQAEATLRQTRERIRQTLAQLQRTQSALTQQQALAQQSHALAQDNLQLAEKAFALGESDLATLLRVRATAQQATTFLAQQNLARAAHISRLNQAFGVLP